MRTANSGHLRSIVTGLILIGLAAQTALAEEKPAAGPFQDSECMSCHSERDPELVAQLRAGPHAERSGVVCSSCHADRHEGVNATARQDVRCTQCHDGPASQSYASSKHGVINRLDEQEQVWRQPLQRGNYRAPSCSYCHLHDGDHSDTMSPGRGPELGQWICSGCHSPRYIAEQFASGRRQLSIADLKLAEGEDLIALAVNVPSDLLEKLKKSLLIHRKNVLYGVGHQSPDYQWWLGQPALDGDLIRIREAISKKPW